MLALKASVEAGAGHEKVKTPTSRKGSEKWGTQRTLVFDEIDTGIGGRAAEAVGK
jgi:DNA repair protein RecN (Recombination protein N)